MWRSLFKIAAATTAFAVVHSLLASRPAKRAAAQIVGERNRNGLYRVFYLAQSVATVGFLAAYIRKQPGRELYRIEGRPATLMRSVQGAALVYATAAASQVGLRRILGIESLFAWLRGEPVPSEPEAQGPALDAEGRRRGLGPFAWSRHPLNFAPLPVLWLFPRMTTNLFAFNAVATIYLVVGSLHEEMRLRQAFGADYDRYAESGVRFYLPGPCRLNIGRQSHGCDSSRSPADAPHSAT